ncbi:MAG: hypothetical protein DIU83_00695 [Bacillota bacterium]|nr:MAG: hypothetical protein DIU83_00695 [Bacillota bacterium]
MLLKSGKQRYYAALEREQNAGRLLDRRRREEMTTMEARSMESRGEEQLYAEIGARAYRAFANILDSLGDMAGRTGAVRTEVLEQAVRRGMDPVLEELRHIRHKLEQHDVMLHEATAGIRRIDKFTLEAFQRLNAPETVYGAVRYAEPPPGRLSKEETTERALEAARELLATGERLTLKAVARRAGLRYAQVVYAFGRKEELISRLQQEGLVVDDVEETEDAGERTA